MPSWSTDEVKALISEVELRHSIWNVYSDEYKDRVKRSDAWKEIAEVLQRNQVEVIYGVSSRSHRKRFLFVKLIWIPLLLLWLHEDYFSLSVFILS